MGEDAEIALVVKSRRGKPPKKDDGKKGDGGKKKKHFMECRSKKCPKRFNFGDEEDGDEMVAASKVGQTGENQQRSKQTDRQTKNNRQTNKQTDTQTDRQTNK